jgi:Arc/MetJ family transcription regulator
MTTHLAIDDELINEALALGHFKTKEDTVTTALREFINRRKQIEITGLFGQFDPDPNYGYKIGRHT